MKNLKTLLAVALLAILVLHSCSKGKIEPAEIKPTNNTNGVSSFIFDGKSYQLDCFADRGINPDNCGKIDLIFYRSKDLPSINFFHFPENSSGEFNVGDGNSQRACNQIYAYVIVPNFGSYTSKAIILTKTESKSFKYSGTVYDPVTNNTHTISGEGFYKN